MTEDIEFFKAAYTNMKEQRDNIRDVYNTRKREFEAALKEVRYCRKEVRIQWIIAGIGSFISSLVTWLLMK